MLLREQRSQKFRSSVPSFTLNPLNSYPVHKTYARSLESDFVTDKIPGCSPKTSLLLMSWPIDMFHVVAKSRDSLPPNLAEKRTQPLPTSSSVTSHLGLALYSFIRPQIDFPCHMILCYNTKNAWHETGGIRMYAPPIFLPGHKRVTESTQRREPCSIIITAFELIELCETEVFSIVHPSRTAAEPTSLICYSSVRLTTAPRPGCS